MDNYDFLKEKECKCCCNQQIINNNLNLYATQATMINNRSILLNDESIIKFDNIVYNSSGISLNPNGSFKVNNKGIYIINYTINLDGSSISSDISFSCNNIEIVANNAVQGQFVGQAVLELNENDTISIINTSGQDLRISNLPIQASIIIMYNK